MSELRWWMYEINDEIRAPLKIKQTAPLIQCQSSLLDFSMLCDSVLLMRLYFNYGDNRIIDRA